LRGTELADRLRGSDRDDYFIGLGGNDTIDGGAGTDLVRYDNTDGGEGVFVDLAQGIARVRWDGRSYLNSLTSIEDVRGSRGDDTIRGDLSANLLLGGSGGSDILYGDGVVAAYMPTAAAQVFRIYQATLGRAPDDVGFANWTARLYEGERSLASVVEGFVGSPEFQARYGDLDDRAFVELLYQNVLDRGADAQGLARWTGDLAAGARRSDVVMGFSESPEFVAGTAAAAGRFTTDASQQSWGDDVFRLYQATLDRPPDVQGFEAWTGRLAGDATLLGVVGGFVGSPEFQARYGDLDDGAFVDLLYRNVLERAADAQGAARWTGELAEGATRAEVVLGFVASPEFVRATADDLIDWMRALDHDGFPYHDYLIAWSGSDVMAGGLYADAFVFDTEDRGQVRILDLEPWDALSFRGFSQFATPSDVLARLEQRGSDTVFEADGLRIVLQDIDRADITAEMILV
jgi:hypothetical protein